MRVRSLGMIAGLLGLAVLGYLVLRPRPTRIEVVRVVEGPIREYVEEQGRTRLPRTHIIAMPYEGRVQPIALEEGDPVSAGQVVARVVPDDLRIQVDAARAAVARLEQSMLEQRDVSVERSVIDQARQFLESVARTVEAAEQQVTGGEAQLDFANRELQRTRQLIQRDAATEKELNLAERDQVEATVAYQQDVLMTSAIRSMQSAFTLTPVIVEQYIDRKELGALVTDQQKREAQARLEQALLDQVRGTLTSPIDGVVLRRTVSSERLLSAGTELLEIGDLTQLEIEADVLSSDAARIKPGQDVEIHGLSIEDEPAQGWVRRLLPSGFTKLSSLGVEQQRVRVLIALRTPGWGHGVKGPELGVGYRVQVRIQTAAKPNAVLVPRSAVFRASDGQWKVFTVKEGRCVLASVSLGLANDTQVEIREGLQPNQVVVPAPESTLEPGDRVIAEVVPWARP